VEFNREEFLKELFLTAIKSHITLRDETTFTEPLYAIAETLNK